MRPIEVGDKIRTKNGDGKIVTAIVDAIMVPEIRTTSDGVLRLTTHKIAAYRYHACHTYSPTIELENDDGTPITETVYSVMWNPQSYSLIRESEIFGKET